MTDRDVTPYWKNLAKPKKRRGRVRAQSKKGAVRAEEAYLAGQQALQLDGFRCRARGILSHVCTDTRGVDPHHLAGRDVRRDLIACVDNIVALCRTAHDLAEASPAESRAMGLYRYSWDPVLPPRPYLVDPDGREIRPA